MAANTFTLQVNVASDQVQLLKNAGYSLCISKKVNGSYCVVWQGTGFNAHNTFRWTEEYRVFACNQFKTGALVEASCEPVDIQFGQTAILDETGTMLPAQGPVTGESFAVTNLYQPVNFAVNQYIGSSWSPIYVDKTLTVIGDDPSETFTPIVSVLVWFSKSLTTSSMFTTASSSSIEAVYRGQVTQTVSYDDTGVNGNGMWFLGTKVTGFTAVPPRSYSGDKGFVNLSHANDAFAVAAIVNKFTDAQGDDQGGTGTTVGSQATGRVGIAPPKCPMTAIMSFQNGTCLRSIFFFTFPDGFLCRRCAVSDACRD
ncbi:hypothetical protein C8F01DRAFT_1051200 [Mycena amicta]|nr:hypothetical protein C8F01DRAFT_1051200 [Mycena amicta]